MSLAIISPGRDPKVWIEALRYHQPEIDIQVYPEIDRPEAVEMALLWQHPPGYLKTFPNLKLTDSSYCGRETDLVHDELCNYGCIELSSTVPSLSP